MSEKWYNRTHERTKNWTYVNKLDTAVEMNRNGDCGSPVPDYMDANVSVKVVKDNTVVYECG